MAKAIMAWRITTMNSRSKSTSIKLSQKSLDVCRNHPETNMDLCLPKKICWKGNCFGSGCHEPQIWMHPGFKDQYSDNFERSTMFKQDALRQLPYPSGQMSQVPRTSTHGWHGIYQKRCLQHINWHPTKASTLAMAERSSSTVAFPLVMTWDSKVEKLPPLVLGSYHQNGNKLLKTVIYQIFVGSWVS